MNSQKPAARSADPPVEEEAQVADKPSSKGSSEWHALLQRLTAFKEQHGHCNATAHNEGESALAAWVNEQRERYKESAGDDKLTQEQVAELTQLGFEWQPRNPRHLQWETRFGQLQAFKKTFGHVQVPIGWSENVQLANWVSKQRQEYKNLLRGRTTRLDDNRMRLLNGIGFAWQLQRGGRRRQLKVHKKSASSSDHAAHRDAAHGDHSSAAPETSKDGNEGGDDDDDGPCILPGEVLIGQGAALSPSPAERADAFMRGGEASRKLQGGPASKGNSQLSAAGQGPTPHPTVNYATQSTMLASSQLGLPLSGAGGAAATSPSLSNSNHLLELWARNTLYQNLHRQATAPASIQMLGLPGGFPNMGFQGYSQRQSLATAPSHQQLLAQVQAARTNALFHPSMFSQFSNAAGAGAAANLMGVVDAPGGPRQPEESKLPGDDRQQHHGMRHINMQLLQQQQLQRQLQQQQQQGRGGTGSGPSPPPSGG